MGKQPRKQSKVQSGSKTIARDQQPRVPQPIPEQGSADKVREVKIVTAVAPLSDAAKAANSEFQRIEQQVGPPSRHLSFIATNGCDMEPEWCIPNVACVARVTLTQEGRDAFEAHRAKCQPAPV